MNNITDPPDIGDTAWERTSRRVAMNLHPRAPKGSNVPATLPDADACAYRMLMAAHCDQGHTDPKLCVGKVTIDRNGVTTSCPICGDARATWPDDVGDVNEGT